jgi:hypothetical protein
MSEEYTEQETREAFAAARAEVLTYVRPAGAAQAMHTVRRRHRAGIVAVAVGAAVVVGGVVTATNLVTADRAAPASTIPPSSPSAAARPSASEVASVPASLSASLPVLLSASTRAALRAMATRAASAIDLTGVTTDDGQANGKGSLVMNTSQAVDRLDFGITGAAGATDKSGDYIYEIACVGTGTLRARFWAGPSAAENARNRKVNPSRPLSVPPDAAEMRVTCGDRPAKATARVHAAYPHMVYVSVEADQTAIGKAGYADLVRTPNRDGL